MAEVRLVDLDVITRFSLAVRRDAVPAEELLASLDASRALVVAAMEGERPVPSPRPRARSSSSRGVRRQPAAVPPATRQPVRTARSTATRRSGGASG